VEQPGPDDRNFYLLLSSPYTVEIVNKMPEERIMQGQGGPGRSRLRGLGRSGPTPPVETRSNAEKWLVAYHEGQAAVRLGNTLGTLVAFHQAEAEKYRDRPKGDAA
jgi:hypothetical protein